MHYWNQIISLEYFKVNRDGTVVISSSNSKVKQHMLRMSHVFPTHPVRQYARDGLVQWQVTEVAKRTTSMLVPGTCQLVVFASGSALLDVKSPSCGFFFWRNGIWNQSKLTISVGYFMTATHLRHFASCSSWKNTHFFSPMAAMGLSQNGEAPKKIQGFINSIFSPIEKGAFHPSRWIFVGYWKPWWLGDPPAIRKPPIGLSQCLNSTTPTPSQCWSRCCTSSTKVPEVDGTWVSQSNNWLFDALCGKDRPLW